MSSIKQSFLSFIFIIFFPINSFSQSSIPQADSLGFYLLKQSDDFLAEDELEKANALMSEAGELFFQQENWVGMEQAYKKLYNYNRVNNSVQAFNAVITYFEEADSLLTTLPKEVALKTKSLILCYTGYIYHYYGDYSKAFLYYERAFIPAEQAGERHILIRLYSSAATVLWAMADDDRALIYRDKSLKMSIEQKDTTAIIYNLKEFGKICLIDDPVKSISFYEQALALSPDKPNVLMLLSKAYLEKDTRNLDKALKTANRSYELAMWEDEKTDASHQLGRVYFNLKQYDRAIEYYQAAQRFGIKGYNENHPEYAKIFRFIGTTFLAKKEYSKALESYNQCLNALLPLFNPESNDQNPDMNQLTEISLWVLESLQGKSYTYAARYKESNNTLDQEKALVSAELAVQYLQRLKSGYGEDGSKYRLNNNYYSVCESAIASAYELSKTTGKTNYVEKAFAISENNKAVVLSEALYRNDVKRLAGIPDRILKVEKEHHEQIAYWTNQLNHSDTKGLKQLKDSLFLARRQLESFERKLENTYPEYAQEKFGYLKPQKIEAIQNELEDNTMFVEYFLGTSNIYIFIITSDQFRISSRERTIEFDQLLDAYLKSVSDWGFVNDSPAKASEVYLNNGYKLYEFLLEKDLESVNVNNLIIVPDGKLSLISFESLLTRPYTGYWTDRDLPLLLKDYSVSYQLAAKFIKNKHSEKLDAWGGFGTEYHDLSFNDIKIDEPTKLSLRDGGRLLFADDEVRTIADLWGGTSWLNEEATRENFLNNAAEYGILHLATHGILDRKNPLQSHLLFSRSLIDEDPSVYAHEIYGMQLKSGLTVLSACNTGSGKWTRGEGVMSLARAFSFAGCPSVVMSLWSVSDQSTSTIMTSFYKHLKSGQSKNQALRMAKLDYLETSSAEYSKPIYWASFVPIGDMSSLTFASNEGHSKLKYGLLAILLLSLLWFRYIR